MEDKMCLFNRLCKDFKTCVLYWMSIIISAFLFGSGCTSKVVIPPVENTESLTQALMRVDSTGLIISSRALDSPSIVSVQAQSFNDWEEFFNFAVITLGAKRVYDDNGRTIGVKGEYVQYGEIIFRDPKGNLFKQYDFISAYLGIQEGLLRIGNIEINLSNTNPDSGVIFFNSSEENCDGQDCVSGVIWKTQTWFYHSVGGKTIQTSGGLRTVSHDCCTGGGQLVLVDGVRKCRYRNPGTWECYYDQKVGRVICIPTTQDPEQLYRYTNPAICSHQILNNHLSINLKLIFDPNNFDVLEKTKDNIPELETGRWGIDLGQAGPTHVSNVIGICGFHTSTRGGSVRTSYGWTGDDDIICTQNLD